MSVLRAPGDSNVSQGFGALGQALSQMFDPRLRWEAYELQQRIAMQRLQMQELQRKFGSRDDLKHAYMTNPLFRQLPQEWYNYAIEHDIAPNDLMKEAALYAEAHGDRSYGAAILAQQGPWKETYAPIVDAQTQADAQAALARQKEIEAAGTAAGTLIGGGKTLAPGEVFNRPGEPFAPIQFNGQTMTFGATPSGAARTPSASDNPPVSVAAQTAPASAGAGAQMNSGQAGSSTVGGAHGSVNPATGASVTYDPNANVTTMTGQQPTVTTAQGAQIKFAQDGAQADFNKQHAVNQAEGIIRDIRTLETMTKTGGFQQQLSAAFRQHLYDEYHIALDPTATAQTAIGSLLVDTLGQVRQAQGLTTVRVGEINPIVKPTLGDPRMPPGALDTILAQEQSGLEIDKKNIALANAYMRGDFGAVGSGAAEVAYLQAKKANEDGYQAIRERNNQEFNTIVNQAQQPQDVGGGGGFFDNLFGGNRPPPQPAPPQPAPPAPAPPIGAPPIANAAAAPPPPPPPPPVQPTSPQAGGGFNYNYNGP